MRKQQKEVYVGMNAYQIGRQYECDGVNSRGRRTVEVVTLVAIVPEDEYGQNCVTRSRSGIRVKARLSDLRKIN